jgi:CotS family spore coat protein
MQGILGRVREEYNIEIINTMNYRGGTVLLTPFGKKMLKKIPFSADRIHFIHRAKEHLYEKKFSNLDRYLCTKSGEPFAECEGERYTISNMVDGRECNFDSRPDLNSAVSMLAIMHKASQGFEQTETGFLKSDLGKLPNNFQKRLSDISKMKKKAIKERGKFDTLFLDWVDYFYKLGEDALDKLNLSKYYELVEQSRKQGYFCHHDYTHSNIILNEHKTYIINFDSCCVELKVYDLTNLLRRKMRKCNWDIKEAKNIIDEYKGIETISKDEFEVLRIMLQFPQKFWRISNRYYNTRHGWAEKIYMSKLNEVVEEVQYHQKFMEDIEQIMS